MKTCCTPRNMRFRLHRWIALCYKISVPRLRLDAAEKLQMGLMQASCKEIPFLPAIFRRAIAKLSPLQGIYHFEGTQNAVSKPCGRGCMELAQERVIGRFHAHGSVREDVPQKFIHQETPDPTLDFNNHLSLILFKLAPHLSLLHVPQVSLFLANYSPLVIWSRMAIPSHPGLCSPHQLNIIFIPASDIKSKSYSFSQLTVKEVKQQPLLIALATDAISWSECLELIQQLHCSLFSPKWFFFFFTFLFILFSLFSPDLHVGRTPFAVPAPFSIFTNLIVDHGNWAFSFTLLPRCMSL